MKLFQKESTIVVKKESCVIIQRSICSNRITKNSNEKKKPSFGNFNKKIYLENFQVHAFRILQYCMYNLSKSKKSNLINPLFVPHSHMQIISQDDKFI
jgi:hypothetical protein